MSSRSCPLSLPPEVALQLPNREGTGRWRLGGRRGRRDLGSLGTHRRCTPKEGATRDGLAPGVRRRGAIANSDIPPSTACILLQEQLCRSDGVFPGHELATSFYDCLLACLID